MKLVDILAVAWKEWPDDSVGLIVDGNQACTRAEWQAAVDALNAPKTVEWDGEGYPPIGVFCEYLGTESGIWSGCEIVATRNNAWIVLGDGYETDFVTLESLRPRRTAEQVAAEERYAKAKELYLTINWNDVGSTWDCLSVSRKEDYLKAIDAGYRKEPKPCGS